jgi:type I restriction enzyme S subunit
VPPIDEQAEIPSKIIALINEFGGLIADSQRSASLLRERRSALISAAVTGQIDVCGLVPEAKVT